MKSLIIGAILLIVLQGCGSEEPLYKEIHTDEGIYTNGEERLHISYDGGKTWELTKNEQENLDFYKQQQKEDKERKQKEIYEENLVLEQKQAERDKQEDGEKDEENQEYKRANNQLALEEQTTNCNDASILCQAEKKYLKICHDDFSNKEERLEERLSACYSMGISFYLGLSSNNIPNMRKAFVYLDITYSLSNDEMKESLLRIHPLYKAYRRENDL